MKKKGIVLICIAIFGAATALSAETVLNVEDAVTLALENNLSLSRTKIETDGKKRTADRSWNSLIPTVSASALISHPTSITDDLTPVMDEWKPGFSVSAGLNITPAMFSAIKMTKSNYEAGLVSYETAKQELELQVRKAFYQMQLLKASVSLIEQNVETAQSRYDQTVSLARVGQVSRLDELSAKVDLENLKPTLLSAQAQYANALDSFKQILALPAEEEIVLAGVLEDAVSTIDTSNIRRNGESYMVLSLRQNLEVLELQKKTMWHQAYMPVLSLSWNTSPIYSDYLDSWNDSSGSFSVALSFSLDNYLPWSSTRENIDAVNDSLKTTQSMLTEAQMTADNTIRQLTRTIEQSLQSLDVLNLNVELAEQTYDMYLESYQNGTADLQSLRSAGDSLSLAQNQVQQELYTLLSTVLDLEKELNVPFGALWTIN
ncbi:TolC family protein [Breznakiella homolactica]|uniref:TolC family protein n=1 Tax=Breznakiella homolactica TaxID=2798577 RepID=A0A7T7XJD8_9SPIR|nr:TolC family protein [Breznakiella homolactica]QQO07456.1 TolC family protein [Breznakiella homolactica]